MNSSSRLEELTERVRNICSRGISSPIDIARTQIEIENEILDIRLALAEQVKQRSLNYYNRFRSFRWDDDITHSYNEASAAAKAEMAGADRNIAELKAYKDYFENLSSIIKNFSNSFFRD